jgi:hypothetical protein
VVGSEPDAGATVLAGDGAGDAGQPYAARQRPDVEGAQRCREACVIDLDVKGTVVIDRHIGVSADKPDAFTGGLPHTIVRSLWCRRSALQRWPQVFPRTLLAAFYLQHPEAPRLQTDQSAGQSSEVIGSAFVVRRPKADWQQPAQNLPGSFWRDLPVGKAP